jgi:hypothetical protein
MEEMLDDPWCRRMRRLDEGCLCIRNGAELLSEEEGGDTICTCFGMLRPGDTSTCSGMLSRSSDDKCLT